MSSYLNIYIVTKKEPSNPILLFDVSASEQTWDLYSLITSELAVPYSYNIKKDDNSIDYEKCAQLTISGLSDILESIETDIIRNKRKEDILFKIGTQKPEDVAFEIANIQEYTEELTKQKYGIQFLMYILERAAADYNSIEKFICYCD